MSTSTCPAETQAAKDLRYLSRLVIRHQVPLDQLPAFLSTLLNERLIELDGDARGWAASLCRTFVGLAPRDVAYMLRSKAAEL